MWEHFQGHWGLRHPWAVQPSAAEGTEGCTLCWPWGTFSTSAGMVQTSLLINDPATRWISLWGRLGHPCELCCCSGSCWQQALHNLRRNSSGEKVGPLLLEGGTGSEITFNTTSAVRGKGGFHTSWALVPRICCLT